MSAIPYRCSACPREGVKLWRQDQTFADHTKLLCIDCALADQGKLPFAGVVGERILTVSGRDYDLYAFHGLVLAVPTPEGETFWGPTSIPQDQLDWWKALPVQ